MPKKKTTKKKSGKKPKEVKGVKNAQSWSIDLIVGVIIFMLIIAVFYAILTSKSEQTLDELEQDTRVIVSKISSDTDETFGIIENGIINEEEFNELCNYDYEEVKRLLGIENDICIYLEDQDGHIIPCGEPPKAGIGNGIDIIIGQDVACGAYI